MKIYPRLMVAVFSILFFSLLFPSSVWAGTVTWDGGGDGTSWSSGGNWSGDVAPASGDDVTISANVTVNIASSTTIKSLTLGNTGGTTSPTLNFTYDAIAGGALIIASGDLKVYPNATITHSAGTTSIVGTVFLDIQSGDASISGTINTTSKGYKSSEGPGQGSDGNGAAGGGHGGTGGRGQERTAGGTTYGSVTQPVTLGSGGGNYSSPTWPGGYGGGAIKLQVSGTATVSGSIVANGGNYGTTTGNPGGGAGGSIYISVNTLSGTGTISTNGGNGYTDGGAGGGGRIAIYYQTNNHPESTITAYGGNSYSYGGAGTVYLKPQSQSNGNLIIDNNNRFTATDINGGKTQFGTTETFDTITIQNYGNLNATSSANITYSTLVWSTKGVITDDGGTFAVVSGGGGLTIPATSYLYGNTARTFTGLTVSGVLSHSPNVSTPSNKLDYTVNGDVAISPGGSIDVSSKGFGGGYGGSGTGGGNSSSTDSGGGAHGGTGAKGINYAGGIAYGSVTQPTTLGSGGGQYNYTSYAYGGRGGGAVKLTVSGTITLTGTINANGSNYLSSTFNPGGGAGGSVYLIANTITGAGVVSANGGNGYSGGGGGGGGRIALYYQTNSHADSANTAYGGGGNDYGGAGTIFTKSTAQSNGNLIIDNNNHLTSTDVYLGRTPLGPITLDTLTIQNYGNLDATPSANIAYSSLVWSTKGVITDSGGALPIISGGGDLTVPATAYLFANTARTFTGMSVAGILTHSANQATAVNRIDYTINGNAVVENGGSIDVSQKGFKNNAGTGPGVGGNFTDGSGGAHGGNGGDGSTHTGGTAYGSMNQPTTLGSGGGQYNETYPAGRGGGAVKLNISGAFAINGVITANGGNFQTGTFDPGGGAGGSIYLIVNSASGSGALSANGGNGDGNGGGGGGGRIAFYYGEKTHSGTVTVNGGNGYRTGQTGTKVLKATSAQLLSSPYDTGDLGSIINKLSWTENLESGTDVRFQIRTAPDDNGAPGTWSNWLGPTGIGSYYTDPTGNETIEPNHSDSVDDQWIQYSILLTANQGDQYISSVSQVDLEYVVNTPPNITMLNTPSESSEGIITVNYSLSDPEETNHTVYLGANIGLTLGENMAKLDTSPITISTTSALPASGTIMIDNEMISYTSIAGSDLSGTITRGAYNTKAATHSTGAAVWFIASSVGGHAGAVTSGISKSMTWTPRNDLSNLETSTAILKIIANDGNGANQLDSDSSPQTTIDTKAPINNDMYIDARLNQLTLQSTDSYAKLMKISNNADLSADGVNNQSGNWISFATPYSWQMPTGTKTVYVKYKDEYGNEASAISTTAPSEPSSVLIQDASNPDTNEWRLFVSWAVNSEPPNGFNYYQVYRSTDNQNFSQRAQVNTITQNFYLDSNLVNSTSYYYKVTVVDDHGNESSYNTINQITGSASRSGVGLIPDGSGGGDYEAPVISSLVATNITASSATFTWTTDELSDSKIGYSTNTSYTNEIGTVTMVTSHSISLTGLTPNTKYYYRAISYDAVSNKGIQENSSTQYFTTLPDTGEPIISDVSAVVGETSAGVTWSTNESATSLVEYSINTDFDSSSSSASLVLGHSMTLSDLVGGTTYNYRVTSADGDGNDSTSPIYTFTTLTSTVLDTTAPTISNISVGNITAVSAKVSWDTNEDADGRVEYGESTAYERGIAEGNHTYTKSKSVQFISLSPSTTYHYRVIAVDEAGNLNTSADGTFTTSAQATSDSLTADGVTVGTNAPTITSNGPSVSEVSSDTVTITWTTSKKATSQVYYREKGSKTAMLSAGDATLFSLDHTVKLTQLSPATNYEYQVKSSDVNGNYTVSTLYGFGTSMPGVTGVKVVSITENTALLQWKTAVPTETVVEYLNTQTKETGTFKDGSLTSNHEAQLKNLSGSTIYSFTIQVKDEKGNSARSTQYSFTTEQDGKGPQIKVVNSKSTIISGQNKVQTIITWSTDEQSLSKVEYSANATGNTFELQSRESTDFVTEHIIVLPNLSAATAYRYRVVSKDPSGNEARSEPYVLLTPQKEVTAFDLIIKNLESVFGWTKRIRQ